jgi:hypothetical protein
MPFKGTYIKAVLLFIVFSLNTVVGSACSLSKVFHQAHHHEEVATHSHGESVTHQHDHSGSHHEATEESEECCSKFSVAFNQLDKSVAQHFAVAILTLPVQSFTDLYNTVLLLGRQDDTTVVAFARWRLPATIQDLRIVMQSFQI